jgi:hypothetical protein
METGLMAACGLDCGACEIRRAPADPAAAQVVIDWFTRQGWLAEGEGMAQVMERKMYCTGCLGDRDTHWSADCWILLCCVDQRGLRDCSGCEAFPCERLVEWSEQNDSYGAALVRLRHLREAAVWPFPTRRSEPAGERVFCAARAPRLMSVSSAPPLGRVQFRRRPLSGPRNDLELAGKHRTRTNGQGQAGAARQGMKRREFVVWQLPAGGTVPPREMSLPRPALARQRRWRRIARLVSVAAEEYLRRRSVRTLLRTRAQNAGGA